MIDPKHHAIAEADVDIYTDAFDVVDQVTRATVSTLLNNRLGIAGSIAYIDKGAELYDKFKSTHLPDSDPSKSEAAQLITTHKAALVSHIKDIERLIIVGGGSYDSVTTQELALVGNIFAHESNAPLREIVLVDVSVDFIRQNIQAIKDFEIKSGKAISVIPIQADFKNISGDKFDEIMAAYGTVGREDVKAAVMMTGATFGNIESVSTTDKFPGNEIDVQMAHMSELVGNGSTVMFDYFTKIDTGASYYNTPELAQFFNNVPAIMKKYCRGLENFEVNPSNGNETHFHYRAKPLYNARMIAHELIAEAPQSPKIVNGKERVFPISQGDTLSLMFSLRARADDIYSRPVENTGLKSSFYASSNDLVMHCFKKVGKPGALDEAYQQQPIIIRAPEKTAIPEKEGVFERIKKAAVLRALTLQPFQPAV